MFTLFDRPHNTPFPLDAEFPENFYPLGGGYDTFSLQVDLALYVVMRF